MNQIRITHLLFIATMIGALGACGCERGETRKVEPTSPTPVALATPAAKTSRLTLLVVFDQLSSESLTRFMPHLDENGAIHTLIKRGRYVPRAEIGYANTYTAPGHATVVTGVYPRVHGVASNKVFDGNMLRALIASGEHKVIGLDGATASPAALKVETVGDLLRKQTDGVGKVCALSIKDRAAIFLGGRSPTAVYWFEKDLPGFTTSSYYGRADRPTWLTTWERANLKSIVAPWTLSSGEALAKLGKDDGIAEGDWLGFGTTFPHLAEESEHPYSVARASARSTTALLSLARTAAAELELGKDSTPDLLAISISGTDYAGHTFGDKSWEYVENLIVGDRELGRLIRELESELGEISVVITSDHGHAPVPEASGGMRLVKPALKAELEKTLTAKLGDGPWIAGLAGPMIHLNPRRTEKRTQAVSLLIELLEKRPEIDRAIDLRARKALAASSDDVDRRVARGVPPNHPADLYIVLAKGAIFDDDSPRGAGTSHGSPWAYDREVPVIISSPNHKPSVHSEVADTRQVAATLADMLGVEMPLDVDAL